MPPLPLLFFVLNSEGNQCIEQAPEYSCYICKSRYKHYESCIDRIINRHIDRRIIHCRHRHQDVSEERRRVQEILRHNGSYHWRIYWMFVRGRFLRKPRLIGCFRNQGLHSFAGPLLIRPCLISIDQKNLQAGQGGQKGYSLLHPHHHKSRSPGICQGGILRQY